jgi:hypothetical protein
MGYHLGTLDQLYSNSDERTTIVSN